MGICSKLKEAADESPFKTAMDWLPLVIALIPSAIESLGIISVQNILLSELFPTDIRNISVGVVGAAANIATYCSMMVYPIASGAGSFFELMLGYGAISTFMTVWAIFTVKDTDNMSLVEIENSFRKPRAHDPEEKDSRANKDCGMKSPKLVESDPLLEGIQRFQKTEQ